VSRHPTFKIVLGTLGVLAVLGLFVGLRYWWYYAYSRGSRTGVIRKLSVKGPPYCKYLSGELALTGAVPGQRAEVWEFSVDDDRDSNPLVRELHGAERSGERVTLDYRQDLHMWWRCTPSEYFVTGIEK
jgi:hypothetical protein